MRDKDIRAERQEALRGCTSKSQKSTSSFIYAIDHRPSIMDLLMGLPLPDQMTVGWTRAISRCCLLIEVYVPCKYPGHGCHFAVVGRPASVACLPIVVPVSSFTGLGERYTKFKRFSCFVGQVPDGFPNPWLWISTFRPVSTVYRPMASPVPDPSWTKARKSWQKVKMPHAHRSWNLTFCQAFPIFRICLTHASKFSKYTGLCYMGNGPIFRP